MTDNENTAVEAVAVEPEAHPLVGLPDGHIDHNNDKIVYEYDESGAFIGWHKEPTK